MSESGSATSRTRSPTREFSVLIVFTGDANGNHGDARSGVAAANAGSGANASA
jgi:hypothetical protein